MNTISGTAPRPRFYLGAHHPGWLWSGQADFPLFVSWPRLTGYRTLKAAVVPWALDSGGYSELRKYGAWQTTPREYVIAVARYQREIGSLEWAAPQDWVCAPDVVARTGLTVTGHQQRTVANFTELRRLWPEHSDEPCPFRPALQGNPDDPGSHLKIVGMYEAAGVDLKVFPLVGVGSVAGIQGSPKIGRIARRLRPLGLPFHWFGIKMEGLPQVWPPGGLDCSVTSFDTSTWSFAARRDPQLDGCDHTRRDGTSGNCANCPRYAAWYREERILRLIDSLANATWHGEQGELFDEDDYAA